MKEPYSLENQHFRFEQKWSLALVSTVSDVSDGKQRDFYTQVPGKKALLYLEITVFVVPYFRIMPGFYVSFTKS